MVDLETIYGIEYQKPQVVLLQETGIGVAEIAARTCYDSFDNSENQCVTDFNDLCDFDGEWQGAMSDKLEEVNEIEHSDLLDNLAWTHFHHSILEHSNLSFLIKGTSRGVLQEHARHRIQAISVRSTRYTMSGIINAFIASLSAKNSMEWFVQKLLSFDMFVTTDEYYNTLEIETIYRKLSFQNREVDHAGGDFLKLCIAKSSLDYANSTESADIKFHLFQDGKKKRNVGDAFKHVVTDNWKVDMIVTFNLRSLKNYFTLRDSGAAYFQIVWLAKAMKNVTPSKYLDLIIK